jgi:murein DD-endopeptidase MepM/ murein hydrolase activator NlpD
VRTLVRVVLLTLVVMALGAVAVVTLRVGPTPELTLETARPAIGRQTSVRFGARASGRGLAGLRLELEQGGRVHVLAERRRLPPPAWSPWREPIAVDEIHADVAAEAVPGLEEGEAVLRGVAERAPTWLLHPEPSRIERRLAVRLRPPGVSLVSRVHVAAQGGAGVVVYRLGGTAVKDGVVAGDWFFPGAPLAGGESGERFALFGVPWDASEEAAVRLVVEDDAGNQSRVAFLGRLTPRRPARDTIALDDSFMAAVVEEIRQETPGLGKGGDLLEHYLEINRDLRRRNAEELAALATRSAPSFLWRDVFVPLGGAKLMSSFAEERTYVHRDRPVDEQVHLGLDLASVARAPVPAANRGLVLLARYLGIYGNTVVLDHGHGLMSLYAHLSETAVAPGQEVERGATIGRTGSSGLAGGDHLHFTMLVRGLPVDPREWIDARWVRERIQERLEADRGERAAR